MERVGGGLEAASRRLPVALRELHTDNGGEFINHTLYEWCRRRGVRLTRGRGYKKNDQAYVEQRNWLAVRRTGLRPLQLQGRPRCPRAPVRTHPAATELPEASPQADWQGAPRVAGAQGLRRAPDSLPAGA